MSYGTDTYGSFRWGVWDHRSTELSSQIPKYKPDVITAEEAYGSGLKLADNTDIENGRANYPFDYVVSEDGTLETVAGVRFLMQGVARRIVGGVSSLLSQTFSLETISSLELDIVQIALEDERIVSIPSVNVQRVRDDPDALSIGMDVVSERTAYEAVFTIEPSVIPPANTETV